MRPLLAFAAVFLTSTLTFAADTPAAKPAEPTTRPTESAVGRFPSFGVSFSLPRGWSEVPREKAGRVGQWIGPDSTSAAMKQLIMIETGRPGAASIDMMARSLARNFGGIVMDDKTTLGGEPAMVVRAENHDDELAPVYGLVCIHGENVYLVMGGAVKGRDVMPEIEAIRSSWKWTEVEKPAGHLTFRDKAFPAFDGSITLNAPAMMHSVPPDDPRTQLDLALHNLSRNAVDFRVSATLAFLPQGETFDDGKDRFLKDLSTQYKFTAPPAWKDKQADGLPRHLTGVVEAARPQPAITDTLHHQWAVVRIAENRLLMIHFTYEAETDEERKQCEEAARKVVDSVALVTK